MEYTFIDSDEPGGPTYSWIDATGGTPFYTTNAASPYGYWNTHQVLDLPFTFTYYEEDFDQVWVSTSGAMGVGGTGNNAWGYRQLPGSGIGGVIAPWWYYMAARYRDGGNIFYDTGTDVDHGDYFVVEWHNVNSYYYYGYVYPTQYFVTYEVILFEDGLIRFQYEDVTVSGYYYYGNGYYGSIGIESPDQSTGLNYEYNSYNTNTLDEELAIDFQPPIPPDDEMRIKSVNVPDPFSLADANDVAVTVINKGVNQRDNVAVNAQVFTTTVETVLEEDFNDGDPAGWNSGDPGDWNSGLVSGAKNGWGTGTANDQYNRGKDGDVSDGQAMSAGRKGHGPYPGAMDLPAVLYDYAYDTEARNGKLYVANYDTWTIAVSEADGTNVHKLTGYPGSGSYSYRPRSVAADSDGNVYFTTYGSSNGRLYKYNYNSTDDTYSYAWYKQHSGSQTLYYPMGVTWDPVNDEVLVSAGYLSSSYMYVSRWDPDNGNFIGRWRSYLGAPCYTSCRPMGIEAVDVSGSTHVFIAYYGYSTGGRSGRVVEFSSSGTQLNTYYGQAPGQYGSSYNSHYFYDVASDGTYLYYGPYYRLYGGVTRATIGTPASAAEFVDYTDLQHNYKYGFAADDDYLYLATAYDDAVDIFDTDDGSFVKMLGPSPYDSWMSMPSLDLSDAVGGTLTFDHTWGSYYMYEGAYMEVSLDGGNTYEQVTDFVKGNYYGQEMVSNYNNPYAGLKGWTYYSFGNSGDMYRRETGNSPYPYVWQGVEIDLTPWAGNDDVRFQWRVGYSTYWYYYYNGWYRLDNVKVEVIAKDLIAMDETEHTGVLDFKDTEYIEFTPFVPAANGLRTGDTVGVSIEIIDDYNDNDTSNNLWTGFREVKYVVYSENFEGPNPLLAWDTSYTQTGGSNQWEVTDTRSHTGNNALWSDAKGGQGYPGSTAAATPALDLSVAVEATLEYWHSYMFYYRYDGLIVELSADGGSTWEEIAPSDRGNGQPGYDPSYYGEIYNYAYYQNPLRGLRGWTYYDTDHAYPYMAPWEKVTYDLTPYVGNDDVRVRWQVGWASYYYSYYAPYFYALDDMVITGLVYNDNVAVPELNVVDPLPVDGTPDINARVVNAGVNDQISGRANVKLTIGPMGLQTVYEEDHESYANKGEHTWTATTSTDPGGWSATPGWTFPTIDASSGTKAWGPDTINQEFGMYFGGGDGMLVTEPVDLADAPEDAIMTMTHRYNWIYYASATYSYDGGIVEISTDDGVSWTSIAPTTGYPGTIYDYAGYGNPLYGQAGFTHTSGGSTYWPDGGWVDDSFDLSPYLGEEVRFRFHFGVYDYYWSGDGDIWVIDDVSITGTGMESVIYQDTVAITGGGVGGVFESGESQDLTWNYHFAVPGEYKIQAESWLDSFPGGEVDDFPNDNNQAVVRETMFTVSFSDAEEEEIGSTDTYTSDWSVVRDSGTVDWITTTSDYFPGSPTHAWGLTDDTYNYPNGDDASLISPVFDLSQSTSAKMVFQHKYVFYASPPNYYYEGGRVEISDDGGNSWQAITPTSGKLYDARLYYYTGYGNPLADQMAFAGTQSSWVETQIRLDAFTGPGMDNLRLRFHLGASYPDWNPVWFIDDIGIYALGFDIKQTKAVMPYKLELGESATITTAFKNAGMGDLGSGGPVQNADVYAWVEDMNDDARGTTVWSNTPSLMEGTVLNNLPMSALSGDIDITFPGLETPGMYTVGVKLAASGTDVTLPDLFTENNYATHMLLIGTEQDFDGTMLSGDSNWQAVPDEPIKVGDGALKLTWDFTDVPTDTLAIDIDGQVAPYYDPALETIALGTNVTWTNNDALTHFIADKDGEFNSGPISPSETWSWQFEEVGVYQYYDTQYPQMEGTLNVIAAAEVDQTVRTPYIPLWSQDSYLMFWANYDMAAGNDITVYAQEEGTAFEEAVALWTPNRYSIMDGTDHSEIGDSLMGTTDDEWVPYYIHLDSDSVVLDYYIGAQGNDNQYSFVFRVTGPIGEAAIGGVKVVRTLDYGIYWHKVDRNILQYEIVPSLTKSVDYYVHNTGTRDNTLSISPALNGGTQADGITPVDMSLWKFNVSASDTTSDTTLTVTFDNDTFSFDIPADHDATFTISVTAPVYDPVTNEPYSRSYPMTINGYDEMKGEAMPNEPSSTSFIIRPPKFAVGEMTFNKQVVLAKQGSFESTLEILVETENTGNYAQNVLVVFYVYDPNSDNRYNWADYGYGQVRAERLGQYVIPLMAPKQVLETEGKDGSYTATMIWDNPQRPEGTAATKWSEVTFYAVINPDLESSDIGTYEKNEEYGGSDQMEDNIGEGSLKVVDAGVTSPSFALGLAGLAIAALVGGVAMALRRREDEE